MCVQGVLVALPIREGRLVCAQTLPSWCVRVTSQTARQLGDPYLTGLLVFTLGSFFCVIRMLDAYDVKPLQLAPICPQK